MTESNADQLQTRKEQDICSKLLTHTEFSTSCSRSYFPMLERKVASAKTFKNISRIRWRKGHKVMKLLKIYSSLYTPEELKHIFIYLTLPQENKKPCNKALCSIPQKQLLYPTCQSYHNPPITGKWRKNTFCTIYNNYVLSLVETEWTHHKESMVLLKAKERITVVFQCYLYLKWINAYRPTTKSRNSKQLFLCDKKSSPPTFIKLNYWWNCN